MRLKRLAPSAHLKLHRETARQNERNHCEKLVVPPSVEDQTRWEMTRGNKRHCCGKPDDASKW